MRTAMTLLLSLIIFTFAGDAHADWNWKFWEVKEVEAKVELSRDQMIDEINTQQRAWFDKQVEKRIDDDFRVIVENELTEWYEDDLAGAIQRTLKDLSDLEVAMLHALCVDGKIKVLLIDKKTVTDLMLAQVN